MKMQECEPTCALLLAMVHLVREPGVASWNTAAPFPVTTLPANVQLLIAACLAPALQTSQLVLSQKQSGSCKEPGLVRSGSSARTQAFDLPLLCLVS